MSAERLAAGFAAYVSAEEVALEAPAPDEASEAPTTSIATTVCIISTRCPADDD